jgi:dTDP-4-amino-4,6-dideoxygalactose transaminase
VPTGAGSHHDRIWLSPPHLGGEELALVQEAFASNWIAPLGPQVDAFEQELAAVAEVGHAAALSSGTAAIHLALLLLGIKPGDLVFCSAFTFVGSCNPIRYVGAIPVFIDSEPESWNMSPAAVERALHRAKRQGHLPRAAIVVNLYGQSANMQALVRLFDAHGVAVIEDAAESLGAKYQTPGGNGRWEPSGSFGRVGVFSFNGNKIITTSGGGALVSADGALIREARRLASQARDPAEHYEHTRMGFNYRMSNLLAAVGRGQLRVLGDRVASRRAVFERYRDALSDLPGLIWMPEPAWSRSTRWLSAFTLEGLSATARRDQLLRLLADHNVEARPLWKPMQLQPLYADAMFEPHADGCDVSAKLFATGLCLPSGSSLTTTQQDRVISLVRQGLQ